MFTTLNKLTGKCLFIALYALMAREVSAATFLGDGQAGSPGWAAQLWPYYQKTDSASVASSFFQLAWFSETGFTGTDQDQIELWAGVTAGHQESDFEGNDSRWGTAYPQIGAEWYYKVFASKAAPNTEGYRAWWISPFAFINFPNGSDKSSGFGAGADQYSATVNMTSFFGYDRWILSASPVGLNYYYHDRNYTELEDGRREKLQAGLTLNLADMALGYQVTDSLALGIHHQYDVYNAADSDFKRSERGMVGPSFTYSGLVDKGLWITGTLDFDYYNENTEHGVTFNAYIGKSF